MRRSLFDLSFEHKFSTDMGLLVPIVAEEVLAGDTFIGSSSALLRVAPLANPVMHRVEVRIHHWYVPNRILWDGWEGFITGRDDGVTVPTITLPADVDERRLVDHMGMPPKVGLEMNALYVRAYNLIWNEFYRDQDLQTARTEDELGLARICWQKDYLTVARPQPQQGDPEGIPVSQGYLSIFSGAKAQAGNPSSVWTPGQLAEPTQQVNIGQPNDPQWYFDRVFAGPEPGSAGSLSIDINELRRAMAFQRFAEARAKFGERYVDYLRFIGVNPSDGRLDRPEYLGGGKQTISFSEVLATAEGTSTGVGDMFGHGITAMRSKRYRKMFEEHGILLSLLSVRPKTVYEEIVPRKFTRTDNMSYWQRELETLPWQEVSEGEVHMDGDPDTVFGYVPRFEEYRHSMSYVSGSLRGGTENDWHMARSFASPPTLNSSFVECTPTDRIYQDTNMPECIISTKNRILAKRPVRGQASMGQL